MDKYDFTVEKLKKEPTMYLGQEVKTPYGLGIIVELKFSYDEERVDTKSGMALVWTGKKTSWPTYEYRLDELEIIK